MKTPIQEVSRVSQQKKLLGQTFETVWILDRMAQVFEKPHVPVVPVVPEGFLGQTGQPLSQLSRLSHTPLGVGHLGQRDRPALGQANQKPGERDDVHHRKAVLPVTPGSAQGHASNRWPWNNGRPGVYQCPLCKQWHTTNSARREDAA